MQVYIVTLSLNGTIQNKEDRSKRMFGTKWQIQVLYLQAYSIMLAKFFFFNPSLYLISDSLENCVCGLFWGSLHSGVQVTENTCI